MTDLGPSLSPKEHEALRARIQRERSRLERACIEAGRSPTEVRLLAVSKRMPVSMIEAAYHEGQRDFGENYAQELAQKADALSHLIDIRWHMIGHLQSNKAKLIAPFVSNVSSVDSVKLARELSKQATQHRPADLPDIEVFLEVNIGEEPQKSGALPDDVPELIEVVRGTPRLRLRGLLCIPPDTPDAAGARPYFAELRKLRDSWGGRELFPELSMGMSRDLEIAVQEGATWVRIGTAIFGERSG
jgi:PLP dependent protein